MAWPSDISGGESKDLSGHRGVGREEARGRVGGKKRVRRLGGERVGTPTIKRKA